MIPIYCVENKSKQVWIAFSVTFTARSQNGIAGWKLRVLRV